MNLRSGVSMWLGFWLALTSRAQQPGSPQQPGSFLAWIELDAGQPRLLWNSAPGVAYQVLSRESLQSGTWEKVATLVSDAETTSWLETEQPFHTRFYRILQGESGTFSAISVVHAATVPPSTVISLMASPYSAARSLIQDLASRQFQIPLPLPDIDSFAEIILPQVQIHFDDENRSITLSGATTLLNQPVELLLSGYWGPAAGALPIFTLGIKLSEFNLSMLHEGFSGTPLANLDLTNSIIILSQTQHTIDPLKLPGKAYAFYEGEPVQVERGLNLFKMVDLSPLPFVKGLRLLDIPAGELPLQGFVGVDPNILFSGAKSSKPALLHLHSLLPNTPLPSAPDWISTVGRRLDISLLTPGAVASPGLAANSTFPSLAVAQPTFLVTLTDEFKVTLGDDELTFKTVTDLLALEEGTTTTITGATTSVWNQPFGIEWLNLRDVLINLVLVDGEVADASLSGTFAVNAKECVASVQIRGETNPTVELTLTANELSAKDIVDLLERHAGPSALSVDLPAGLSIKTPVISLSPAPALNFSVTGKIPILGGLEADLLLSVVSSEGLGKPFVSIRPADFKLSRLIPSSAGTVLGDLALPAGGFTWATESRSLAASALDSASRNFFERLYGATDFTVSLSAGFKFEALLPLSNFPAAVLQALALNPTDRIWLRGMTNLKLADLLQNASLTVESLRLEAELPPGLLAGFPVGLEPISLLGRELALTYAAGTLDLLMEDRLSATLGNKATTFTFLTSLSGTPPSGTVELVGKMDTAWSSPFGVEWLALEQVQLHLVRSTNSTQASLKGKMDLGGRSLDTTIELLSADGQSSARLRAAVDQLSLNDLIAWTKQQFGASPFSDATPDGLLNLRDVDVEIQTGPPTQFTLSGNASMLNALSAKMLLTIVVKDGLPEPILSFGLDDFPLSTLASQFVNTLAGGLKFPSSAFTFARQPLSIPSSELSEGARAFYEKIHGGVDFMLKLAAGVNLGASLPVSSLPPTAISTLGLNSNDKLVLEGAAGITFGMLSGSASLNLTHLDLVAALPAAKPILLPPWLASDPTVQRTIAIKYQNLPGPENSLALRVTDRLGINLDGARRMFVLTTDLSPGGTLSFEGRLNGTWSKPFGVDWLTLEEVLLSLSTDGTNSQAALRSSFPLRSKTIDLGIGIAGTPGDLSVQLTGTVDQLSIDDVIELVRRQVDRPLFSGTPPADFATLNNPTITIRLGNTKSLSIVGTGSLAGLQAELLWSIETETGQEPHILLGIQPAGWSLSAAFPALSNPIVDSLRMPVPTLVFSNAEKRKPAERVQPEEKRFYGKIYGTDDFDLRVPSGLGLLGGIPLDAIPPDGALRQLMNVLGMQGNNLILEGSLGGSLGLVTGGGGSALDALKDLSLRIGLPPMRPSGSPEWFLSGQLALEVTGAPSVAVVGEMTVDVEDDILTFFIKSGISFPGPTLQMVGGIQADEAWTSPFGIEWLTLHKVVVLIGVDATGSAKLGFSGDMIIGEKDIQVAALIAVNATGVPTNLILDGSSVEGLSMSDIVALQARMAAVTNPGAPLIPISQLPDMALRNIALKFALRGDRELEVEPGVALSGDFYMQLQKEGPLEQIARARLKVGEGEISALGSLISGSIGPITWRNPYLDMILSLQEQHLRVGGFAETEIMSGDLEFSVNRAQMSFDFATKIFNQFQANLHSEAELNFGTADLPINAAMLQDFISAATSEIKERFGAVAAQGQAAIADAQSRVNQVQSQKANKESELAGRIENLAEELDAAEATMDAAKVTRDSAYAAMLSARRVRDDAWDLYVSTPSFQAALKAARYSDYVAKAGIYNTRNTAYQAAHNSYLAAKDVYEALPPVEENPKVVSLRSEINDLAAQLQTRRQQLAGVTETYGVVIDAVQQGSIGIDRASFDSTLRNLIHAKQASMTIILTYGGQKGTFTATWDFARTIRENLQPVVDQILREQGIL